MKWRCFNSYGVVFAKRPLVDASYFWQYYASRMWGRILQIVGLVLLAGLLVWWFKFRQPSY